MIELTSHVPGHWKDQPSDRPLPFRTFHATNGGPSTDLDDVEHLHELLDQTRPRPRNRIRQRSELLGVFGYIRFEKSRWGWGCTLGGGRSDEHRLCCG